MKKKRPHDANFSHYDLFYQLCLNLKLLGRVSDTRLCKTTT
jgi:hypothetical protein